MHRLIFALLVCTVAGATSFTATQTDPIRYQDLSRAPFTSIGGLKLKGFVGESGTFALGELRPALHNAAHHHEQEQINVGLTGRMQLTIAGRLYPLDTFGATLAPSNVEHYMANGSADAIATGIEFQPMQRPDLFPPFPKVIVPASQDPAELPPGRQVTADFSPTSGGWSVAANRARSKTLRGERARVTMWDVSAGTSVDLQWMDAGTEQFVFVVDGQADLIAGKDRRTIGPQMLAVAVRAGQALRLRSIGKAHTFILVFES